MPYSSLQRTLAIIFLSLIITLCTSSYTDNPINLRPLRVVDRSSHLESRDSHHYRKLDLQNQAQLTWGNPFENGSFFLANMTLYAPNGLLMVLLEEFDNLTSAIDCQGDDGTMSLTFKSRHAYQYALQTWGHINANDDDRFLLIANHQGCGPDEERQAYIITLIREDEPALTTYLTAEPAPWSDIGGSYDLDFQHIITPPRHLQRRDNWLMGNFDITKEVDFDIDLWHPDRPIHLWHDDAQVTHCNSTMLRLANTKYRRLILDCINCFVTGDIHAIGHLKTHHWKLKEGTLSVNPKGFNSSMELQATVMKIKKVEALSASKDLYRKPVPHLGFEIKHLCTVGVTVALQVGYSTKLTGAATLVFGAVASLPDDALITIDLKNHDHFSVTGFDGAVMRPILDLSAISASCKWAVFTQVDLSFGIDIAHMEALDIELNLKIPQLSETLNVGYSEKGFCSKDAEAEKTGAKVTTALSIELWLEIYKTWNEKKKNLYSYRIFNATKTFNEDCAPVHIIDFQGGPWQNDTEPLPMPPLISPPPDSDD